MTLAQVEYRGTGRRKNSVARVRLVPGEGNITVNNRDVREYLPFESLILDLNQPFDVTETKGNYDVLVNVQVVVSLDKLKLSVTESLVHY